MKPELNLLINHDWFNLDKAQPMPIHYNKILWSTSPVSLTFKERTCPFRESTAHSWRKLAHSGRTCAIRKNLPIQGENLPILRKLAHSGKKLARSGRKLALVYQSWIKHFEDFILIIIACKPIAIMFNEYHNFELELGQVDHSFGQVNSWHLMSIVQLYFKMLFICWNWHAFF